MRRIARRQFLTLAAATVAACRRRGTMPAAPVVIVGAGLAGLRVAELLIEAGRTVVVLEASGVAGGRVRTIRAPFDEALIGEAGAIRIPDRHRRVRDMAGRLGLDLIPFESGNGAALLRVGARTVRLPDGLRVEGRSLGLKPDEIGLSPRALLLKYVEDVAGDLGDPEMPPDAFRRWTSIDALSWPAWLEARGASPGAVAVMTAGGDARELSALYVLRQFALLEGVRQYLKIDGGMDQLPARVAGGLGPIVRYNSAVVAIGQRDDGIAIEYVEHGTSRVVEASRVVMTTPFSTMRQIAIRPALSAGKARVVAELPYFPATRLLFQTRRRFWHADGLSATGRSDQPAEIWDAGYDQAADRGLIAATIGGALGKQLAEMPADDAVARGAAVVAELLPPLGTEIEKGVVCGWAAEPWSRGAFAVFEPGQMSAMAPDLASPEGRVHFAGEHTSPWMGWMEGALESAERAASEVLNA